MDPFIRIVLVEDESITALDAARQLRRLGYQVVAVSSSGPRAIQRAVTHHPDAVLMDIHLQGAMDGVDAARHIQASTPIPVIYVSANVDTATLERIQPTESTGFVSKPIHLPTLHATLQWALAARESSLPRKGPSPLVGSGADHPSLTVVRSVLALARDPLACGMKAANAGWVGMPLALYRSASGRADFRSAPSHGRETP